MGGEYTLRYGIYNPGKGGYRVAPTGSVEGSRARGGLLRVAIADGKITGGEYVPEGEWENLPGLNTERKLVDFGPVVTNGAFRLLHPREGEWLLVPLPGSIGFEARLDLAALGRPALRRPPAGSIPSSRAPPSRRFSLAAARARPRRRRPVLRLPHRPGVDPVP